MKICKKCNETLSLDLFHKDKTKSFGVRDVCKSCVSDYQATYRNNNSDKIKEKKKEDYQKNREAIIKKASLWNSTNKERRQAISLKSSRKNGHKITTRYKIDKDFSDKVRARASNWYHKNKSRAHANVNRRTKERRETDTLYQCACSARNMLTAVTRYTGSRPEGRTHHILGYSSIDLMTHIERLFKPGMSWLNRSEWHIDHIKPVARLIKEGITDPAIINALDNLQPLWAEDNLSKGDKWSNQDVAI